MSVWQRASAKRKRANEYLLRILYRAVLRREPDAEGFDWWLQRFGEHPNDPEEVVKGFLESEEARKQWIRLLTEARIEIDEPRARANAWHELASEQELASFILSSDSLDFSCPEAPEVSVVLAHYGKPSLTFATISSLRASTTRPIELVVIDNDRSLEAAGLPERLHDVCYLPQTRNLGFLGASNLGARQARGEYVLFLNNDVRVFPGAIEEALRAFVEERFVGAVVGRILHFDGRLQEAGALIWSDGATDSYGRGGHPDAGEFRFRRVVDYGSGAFMLTRRSVFETLGGFDEDFAPGYYEDVDYCLRLAARGLRVIYEPRAAIWHIESGSFGATGSRDTMLRNRKVFVEKHESLLRTKPVGGKEHELENRIDAQGGRTAIVVDDRLPDPVFGSGDGRAGELVRALRAMKYNVTIYATEQRKTDWKRVSEVLPPDVEFIAGRTREGLGDFLRERLPFANLLVVSRRPNMEALAKCGAGLGGVPLVYDMESMAAERAALRRRVLGESVNGSPLKDMQHELALAAEADAVIVASDRDRLRLLQAGIARVVTLRHVVVPTPTPAGRQGRDGLLFVGSFQAADTPNSDSMEWFTSDVLPRLRTASRIDGRGQGAPVQLTVAGFVGKDFEPSWKSRPGIRFLGKQDSLQPLYDAAAVFVAPTRFAGGIPIKVLEASAAGIPCVVSPLLADQLGWAPDEEMVVGPTDDPEGFAHACRRLLEDHDLWARVQRGAWNRVRQEAGVEAFGEQMEMAIEFAEEAAFRRGGTLARRQKPAREPEDAEKLITGGQVLNRDILEV